MEEEKVYDFRKDPMVRFLGFGSIAFSTLGIIFFLLAIFSVQPLSFLFAILSIGSGIGFLSSFIPLIGTIYTAVEKESTIYRMNNSPSSSRRR